jgi:hypothetical protein
MIDLSQGVIDCRRSYHIAAVNTAKASTMKEAFEIGKETRYTIHFNILEVLAQMKHFVVEVGLAVSLVLTGSFTASLTEIILT